MGELPGMMELTAEDLSFVYELDASKLESFVCKMPMMNVHATELFVAQVKSGCMADVQAAIAGRQTALDGVWKMYLPDQYELVQNAKVVTVGDYILFVVGVEAEAAASAFQDALA